MYSWILDYRRKKMREQNHFPLFHVPENSQKYRMAYLPADRLCSDLPFTNVGLYVFVFPRTGKEEVWTTASDAPRYLHAGVKEPFTKMPSKLSFLRSSAKHIRSDRETNFLEACKELKITSGNDTHSVGKYVMEQNCTCTFNSRHAAHMRGAWENMAGVAKKILN